MEGSEKRNTPTGVDKDTPRDKEFIKGEIEIIRQNVALMGANDIEMSELEKILDLLDKDEIDPEEALRQAIIIENRKQNYH